MGGLCLCVAPNSRRPGAAAQAAEHWCCGRKGLAKEQPPPLPSPPQLHPLTSAPTHSGLRRESEPSILVYKAKLRLGSGRCQAPSAGGAASSYRHWCRLRLLQAVRRPVCNERLVAPPPLSCHVMAPTLHAAFSSSQRDAPKETAHVRRSTGLHRWEMTDSIPSISTSKVLWGLRTRKSLNAARGCLKCPDRWAFQVGSLCLLSTFCHRELQPLLGSEFRVSACAWLADETLESC